MLQLFNLMKKLLRMFLDLAFMSQIILMVIIFAFVMYWFFDVINCQYLAFLTPVADNISEFMHEYFADSLSKGATKTDGSLFIFIMILLVTIGALTQVKSFAIAVSKKVSRIIDKIKIKNEDEFNAQLRAEADQAILAYRNVILITKLAVKKRVVDDTRTEEEKTKENEEMLDKLVCEFYNRIKSAPCCKFAKNGEQLVVTLKGFTHVDKLLYYVDKALEDLRTEMRKEGWLLRSYSAIDAFDDKALLKDVYFDLQILLKLNLYNEIICYGNFCNRYYMEPKNLFEAYLKGVYDTTEPENVWTLVKKY